MNSQEKIQNPRASRFAGPVFNDYACRGCGMTGIDHVLDLGAQPLANAYLDSRALQAVEPTYPLVLMRCPACHLVQIPAVTNAEDIFSDYLYFSSYSSSWLAHCESAVEQLVEKYNLDASSKVVEVASNDGYLLQFLIKRGIPVLGIEPAENVAQLAKQKGIPTVVEFFGESTAEKLRNEGHSADVIIANNVLAHVPELNDFIAGIGILLKTEGVAVFEFPHLLNLLRQNQFDTIYHEHFCYFSLIALTSIFEQHGLKVFDVQQLRTHGGSLRLYVSRGNGLHRPTDAVTELMSLEQDAGLQDTSIFSAFSGECRRIKFDLLEFLIAQRRQGRVVCGYGAPAKGNTLLNYSGISADLLPFTVDLSEHKQGKCLPGSRIPIFSPKKLAEVRPAFVLILPWNLRHEIEAQLGDDVRDWGGKFVVAIPQLEIF